MMKKEMKDKTFKELLNEGYTEKEIAKYLNVKKVEIHDYTSKKNNSKSREFEEICLQIKEMIQERKTQEIIRYIDSIEDVEFLKKEEKCKLKEFKQEIIEKLKEKKVLKLIERNCQIEK